MIQKPLSRRAIAPVSSAPRPSKTGAIAHRLICAVGAELTATERRAVGVSPVMAV